MVVLRLSKVKITTSVRTNPTMMVSGIMLLLPLMGAYLVCIWMGCK